MTAAAQRAAHRTGGRPGTRKSLGQHFLADSRIVGRILAAAELEPDDVVVEIGPGHGVLTRKLVDLVHRVIAIELDGRLAAALPERLGSPGNLTCVEGDARLIDLAALLLPDASSPGKGSPDAGFPGPDFPAPVFPNPVFKVTANLPYYAANPIIRRLLESAPKPRLMVVMVQQEVAKNMVATPGSMGILSVATQFYAEAKIVCNVSPRAFRPPPKVTSAVVRLDIRERPAVDVDNPEAFFTVVRAGFSAPRKQLRNSLSHGLGVEPAAVSPLLDDSGIDGKRRAETLSLQEWGEVYRNWERLGAQNNG